MVAGDPFGGPDKEIRDLQKIAQGLCSGFVTYAAAYAVRYAVAAERPIVGRGPKRYAVAMLWCAVGREAAHVCCGPRSGPSGVWAAPSLSVANSGAPRHHLGRSAAHNKHGPCCGPQTPQHTQSIPFRAVTSAATAYLTAYAAA